MNDNRLQPRSRMRYFPHLAGSLVLVSATVTGLLNKWEPNHNDPGRVYADKLAAGLPTVCNGITKHVTTEPLVLGDVWSSEKCAEVEAVVIEKGQISLAQCFKVLPPQSAFDAMSSMAHNVGNANVCASRAMGLMNAGRWRDGCQAMSRGPDGSRVWASVKTGKRLANGRPEYREIAGLAARRDDETRTCLKDVK